MPSYSLGNYSFHEPDVFNEDYNRFNRFNKYRLSDRSPAELVAFRVLAGSVYLEVDENNHFPLDKNYFIYPGTPVDFKNSVFFFHLQDILDPYSLSLKKFGKAFSGKHLVNNDFFKEFLLETSLAAISRRSSENVKSFLHVYRALEHMCYALPLVYLRSKTSFKKTFEDFKSFFSDGSAELGFGNKFVKEVMDSSLFSLPCTMDFSSHPSGHFNLLKRAFSGKKFDDFYFDDSYMTLTVPFGRLYGFIVTIRNMYFHHLYGKDHSISSYEMIDPEAFFSEIIDCCLCFLANFYLLSFYSKYE